MSYLNFQKRSRSNWTPASYTAGETAQIMPVGVGDLVGLSMFRVRVAFNGTNGDATASLGDGGDVDRFITTTNSGITATGVGQGTGGSGSTYLAIGRHLYTAADTIDVTFVCDTGADGSAGVIDWWVYVAKVDPH